MENANLSNRRGSAICECTLHPDWPTDVHTDLHLQAGHPTVCEPYHRVTNLTTKNILIHLNKIGTACYALGTLGNGATTGRLICNSGPIDLVYREGLAQASIPHAVHIHVEHPYTVDDLHNLQPALRQFPPPRSLDVASPVKGMNFICAELESLEALAQVTVTGVRPTAKLDSDWSIGFVGAYFYVVTGQEGGSLDIRSRMIEGRMEDPATGSAAAALSALLALKHKLQSASFRITQGVEMGRRSDIGMTVKLTDALDAVERIELSGSSVQVMQGTIQYE